MNEQTYESAMQRLGEITSALEDGSLPLQESLKLYEEAAALVRFCSERLDAAEQTIITLSDAEAQHEE